MLKKTTEDGSDTFTNLKFNEDYHSYIGAYTEALHKHVFACQIPELAKKHKDLYILDVCFGLGYNTGVALLEAIKVNPEVKLKVIALENDLEVLKNIKNLTVSQEYEDAQVILKDLSDHNLVKVSAGLADLKAHLQSNALFIESAALENTSQSKIEYLEIKTRNLELVILLGDARDTIKFLKTDSFQACFFDPFSPKNCPELWQPEFIKTVTRTCQVGARISTYSSARVTKDSFMAAGCILHEGPKLNRRNGGVVAEKR
jgi:tRNA U34 5-methylaminomethyl-2-thiouridine-forming methyltransferase MnmC